MVVLEKFPKNMEPSLPGAFILNVLGGIFDLYVIAVLNFMGTCTITIQDLFAYGDTDGKGRDARLQHPLGVAWSEREKVIYVADSYNHKVRLSFLVVVGSIYCLNCPLPLDKGGGPSHQVVYHSGRDRSEWSGGRLL